MTKKLTSYEDMNLQELDVMKESLENVDGAVSLMLEDKVDAAMNQYNKKSKGE